MRDGEAVVGRLLDHSAGRCPIALITTTIGSYPKPDYVPTPDWFREGMDSDSPSTAYEKFLAVAPADLEDIYLRATAEVVEEQAELGIDIPTDGEIKRENYIYYQCRNFDGFDFINLTRRTLRNGSWVADVPTIAGAVAARAPVLPGDYAAAQGLTSLPVKVTLPGPMTILDSTANRFYPSDAAAGAALAAALNEEVLALVEAGCTWIQVDEPVFARYPDEAVAHGFVNLERCFQGVLETVTRVLHMCCGYPMYLDQPNPTKADPAAYARLAPAVDESSVDVVSLEDAHRRNDLSVFERFNSTKVILGSIKIAESQVETVAEISDRISAVLEHIDRDRLMIGPDCGLGLLPRNIAHSKLAAMVSAARRH